MAKVKRRGAKGDAYFSVGVSAWRGTEMVMQRSRRGLWEITEEEHRRWG